MGASPKWEILCSCTTVNNTQLLISIISIISITLDINLPLSPICLFLTCAICCEGIKCTRTTMVLKGHCLQKKQVHMVRLTILHHLFLEFWFLLTKVTTCCDSRRKCTPVYIRRGKKLGFQLSHGQSRLRN